MPINWTDLDRERKHDVPALPADGLWTMVRTQISGPAVIRIEARGRWKPASGLPECGPDGLRHWAYGRDLLLTRKAPLGALIGKFGGSSSSIDETEIFVVGNVAVLQVDKATGPLFLTMNGASSHFQDHSGELIVTLS